MNVASLAGGLVFEVFLKFYDAVLRITDNGRVTKAAENGHFQ